MFLKFVRSKKRTYVYIMEYLPVKKREENNFKDRVVVSGLGDLSSALIQLEIWKRHPNKIPNKILKEVDKEDLEHWVNCVMEQNHIYNMRL